MDDLIAYARSFIGLPYIYGGKSPIVGFDCSGYVSEILKYAGLLPLHADLSSQQIFNLLENVSTPGLKTVGTIAFFGDSVTQIHHVAFLLNSYTMLEAAGGDKTTLTVADAIKANAFVRGRPLTSRSDLVATLKPSYAKLGLI